MHRLGACDRRLPLQALDDRIGDTYCVCLAEQIKLPSMLRALRFTSERLPYFSICSMSSFVLTATTSGMPASLAVDAVTVSAPRVERDEGNDVAIFFRYIDMAVEDAR